MQRRHFARVRSTCEDAGTRTSYDIVSSSITALLRTLRPSTARLHYTLYLLPSLF